MTFCVRSDMRFPQHTQRFISIYMATAFDVIISSDSHWNVTPADERNRAQENDFDKLKSTSRLPHFVLPGRKFRNKSNSAMSKWFFRQWEWRICCRKHLRLRTLLLFSHKVSMRKASAFVGDYNLQWIDLPLVHFGSINVDISATFESNIIHNDISLGASFTSGPFRWLKFTRIAPCLRQCNEGHGNIAWIVTERLRIRVSREIWLERFIGPNMISCLPRVSGLTLNERNRCWAFACAIQTQLSHFASPSVRIGWGRGAASTQNSN